MVKMANPFEKGTKQFTLFSILSDGKVHTYEQVALKFGEPLSNRTVGVFLRDAEKEGFRFERIIDPELGRTYRMLNGSAAKNFSTISVKPGSYKDRIAAKNGAATKKTAAKKTVAKKAPSKAAPAKKVAAKKAAPTKAPAKKVAAKKAGVGVAAKKRIVRKAAARTKEMAAAKKAAAKATPRKKGFTRR